MRKAVLISCFDWYEARLKPIKNVLEEDGYSVTVFTSDYDHVKKIKIENKNSNCTYIPVNKYKKNVSISRLMSHYLFSKEVLKRLKKCQPDLIYALIPPNSVARACSQYKEKHNDVKLVFDIIDMWPESMPGNKFHSTAPFLYWKNLRDSSLLLADHVFTECELYQGKLDKSIIKKCSTLYLFKDVKDSITIQEEEVSIAQKETLRLCYLGSINHIIDIKSICHIIEILNKYYSVEVKVIGKGENTDDFLDALEKSGARTEYFGAIFDETEKERILGNCDFALNMMVDSVSVGLTIKSVDYLSYGIPLINNIKGDTWEIVEKYNAGINYCDDENFLETIRNRNFRSHQEIYELFRTLFSKEAFLENFRRGMKNV